MVINRFARMCIGIVIVVVLSGVMALYTDAHCQVPCGIYGDHARLVMLEEHIGTVEKSMKKIAELSSSSKVNHNQIVRWVQNKDQHAEKIDTIVTYYFMAQRIKPAEKNNKKAYDAYIEKLTLLHGMLVASMKTKQSTDLNQVKVFRERLNRFKKAYATQE